MKKLTVSKKRRLVVPEEMDEMLIQAKKDNLTSAIMKCVEESYLRLPEQIYCLKLVISKLENEFIEEMGLDLNFKVNDIDESKPLFDININDF